ncbi:MAG TPA: hypothetical protein VGM59_07550 [Dongiaceae bacterium]
MALRRFVTAGARSRAIRRAVSTGTVGHRPFIRAGIIRAGCTRSGREAGTGSCARLEPGRLGAGPPGSDLSPGGRPDRDARAGGGPSGERAASGGQQPDHGR